LLTPATTSLLQSDSVVDVNYDVDDNNEDNDDVDDNDDAENSILFVLATTA
jgi:hypothetical protein